MKEFNIPTVDKSLYLDYKAGKKTLKECAWKFHECGWTNFVDERYTKRVFDEIEHGKR